MRTPPEEMSYYLNDIKRMAEQGMSAREIARELGKERTTIIHHLNKFGLNGATQIDTITYKEVCAQCRESFETNKKPYHRPKKMFCSRQCVAKYYVPRRKYISKNTIRKETAKEINVDFNGEKINEGHNYAWYLKQEKQKNRKMFNGVLI